MTGRGRAFSFKIADNAEDESEKIDDGSSEVSTFSFSGRGRLQTTRAPSESGSADASSSANTPFTTVGRARSIFGRGTLGLLKASSEEKSYEPELSEVKQEESSKDSKKESSSGRGRTSSGFCSNEKAVDSGGIRSAISKMRSLKLRIPTYEDDEKDDKIVVPEKESPTSDQQKSMTMEEPEQYREIETVKKHGKSGKVYDSMTNCIPLICNKDFGIFEYEVRFETEIDNLRLRGKYLAQLQDVLGKFRTFDGVTLYLPKALPDQITALSTPAVDGSGEVNLKIIFRRQQRLSECIHFYNVLFERFFGYLNYQRVGRKSFDPTSPKIIEAHKLEVWPGYVKSVEELEGGVMLMLDVSHRVLSQKTVLDLFKECLQKSRDHWKDMARKSVIGSVTLTRYNNKSYRIDDIDFNMKPTHTFKKGDKDVSYAEYYKSEYNITIQDLNQPMLISRKEVRISGHKEKVEMTFCLVPELCNLTGLTDEMRSNYAVMRDLATYTKLSPFQRVGSYKKFLENIAANERVQEQLNGWGLKFENEASKVKARLLDEETVVFGGDKAFKVGPNADFGRHATSNVVLEPVDLSNWVLMYVQNDSKTAETFEKMVKSVSGPIGLRCSAPRRIALPNDRQETYVTEIRKILGDKHIQIVVTIFPTLRDDRYAAVKRVLCAEIPCASQCINSKTLRNDAKNRSIVMKILLQMNCKLGGSLWSIKIPLSKTMIVGIDTYHEANNKGHSVAGFVATVNSTFTKYYSKAAIQQKKEELINGLLVSMSNALNYYQKKNGYLPDRIIIYRDGVGDGQLQFVQSYEISQLENTCKKIAPDYSPKITFIVVQKRVSYKFFQIDHAKKTLSNPPPGSVLDNTITRRTYYDFFLCSQHVREGATTPSHYIVLKDDNNFEPDIIQRLTYKLSYLYYNWPGSVRVPAPCQYAHKLADLVGASVKRQTDELLADKLFFL